MELESDLLISEKNLSRKINIFLILAIICAAVSLGSYVFYVLCPNMIANWFPNNTADYANAIPVVLASLSGIFFVYIAFLGQRWQMLFQQQEIRDNRKEMKASNKELRIQAEALTNQIRRMDRDFIHQNFFRILEQHFKTRDRLSFSNFENWEMNLLLKVHCLTNYSGEKTFLGMTRYLLNWIDDEIGCNRGLMLSKWKYLIECMALNG